MAIAIFSLVAAAGYAALGQGLIIQDRLQEQRRFWQRLETVFNLIYSDLEQTVDLAQRTTIARGMAFVGYEHGSASEYGSLLEFTRGVHTYFHIGPASPFLRVAYRMHEGGLYRRTWPRLDRPFGGEPAEELLLDGIKDVRLRYLFAADGWAPHWPRTTNPGSNNPATLPRVVEMTVVMDDQKSYRWLFHVGPPR